MDISEVAKRSNISASALRYYEEKGLIESVGRRGLRRVFHKNVLDRLALISLGRAAGFSLDDIAQMLSANSPPQIDRQMLLDKAEELDRSIRRLTLMRDGLKHAAVCSAPSHLECPKFRRLMGLAASGLIEPSSKTPAGKK
ncbi:Redox-sensitive transcriptional activator SoxR [Marinomonas spartinae]|uniref:Redox-sensitive transcriptional activator SoxR n=1 Tax=Marinomonas spartinae TaxID=1792290 RepID=A0A1A8TJD0_9GAMM|nr:helix-turn-helix domain-containing protein [Marinomonas spartinae]SBS26272.1 Redox-sensitive transcriptional activator SoxR [Marinomonas spartinae]SBS32629.1 Redox-sensitive transcriptional activator SoxR [Marinomonas spartinae]